MSNKNEAPTTDEAPATTEGKRGPRVVKHRDEKLADLREKLADMQEQIARLEREAQNEEALTSLAAGSLVTFGFGRAASRRIESGSIIAVARNEKGQVQFNVLVGGGLEAKTRLIDSGSVLLSKEQIESEQAEIDKAVAEAAAAEAAKGGAA